MLFGTELLWFLFSLFGNTVTGEDCDEQLLYSVQNWYLYPQHLTSDRVFFASTIYNGTLFAIGDYNSDPISVIPITYLNTSFNASYWDETDWVFDIQYGNVTEITCYNSYVAVDSKLYILSPGRDSANDGEMYIYDMETKSQVNSSTYSFTMPDPLWETPCTVTNGTHIFGIGGRDVGLQSKTLQIYSIVDDTWYLGANMSYSRYGVCIFYVYIYIYLVT